MDNLRDTILEHIKNKQSLNPTQISLLQDRLSHIVSQFHTPDHPPYAAMIHRALVELKQKGGSTEKSISEFIRREYDDLPWAHFSLLKHHLGLLSEHGEITLRRGFRYSVCGAGLSKGSVKGGKKHRRKKWRWKFERKKTKKLKLVLRANDNNSEVVANDVIETEKSQNGGLQTPKQDDKVPLQLTNGGEDDICSRSKAMDIDPPLMVLTDELENQVEIDQKQQENCQLKLHSPSDLYASELPNEDAIPEFSSPEIPPGFEFMGVEASTLPSEKKEQQRKALPRPVAEELEKADLPSPLQPIREMKQEKKNGKHPERKQFEIMLGPKEIVLALPSAQEGSPMQNDRSQRQLRRWSGPLPDISPSLNVSSPLENSGKCPPVETTSSLEKSQVLKKPPLKFTIITRRNTKLSISQRPSGAQSQPVSVPLSPSTDAQQDEGSDSVRDCHSTQLLKLPQLDEDTPLKKYQRRGRRPKHTMVQDESPLEDIQKQQADGLPKSQCYLEENTSEATLTKEEFTLPNKDNSEKDHQLKPSMLRLRFRPLKRNLDVIKGNDDQSSTGNKLKKLSHHGARKIQKKC